MATALKNKLPGSIVPIQSEVQKPKRLSKAGQWMRENPHGIFEVRDWRAVNR